MLAFGIVLNFAGLGFFCWLLFKLAVHALPSFVAVTVGFAAFHGGAGPIGAVLAAFISGVVTLFVGQMAFGMTHSPFIRAAITTLFAAPAAVAGFHTALSLADISASSAIWREAFALIGAILVGGTAWMRIAVLSPADSGRGISAGTARRTDMLTTTNQ